MQLIIVIVQLKKKPKKPPFQSPVIIGTSYITQRQFLQKQKIIYKRVNHLCFKKLITCDLIILNRILIFKDVLKMYSISIQQ